MQKNKSFLAFIAVLAMASSLGLSNLVQKQDFQAALEPAIKEAQASHCNLELEIVAGEVGSISVEGDGIFGGACIPAQISNGSGVTFNSVYYEAGTCSNGQPYTRYVTDEYDATGISVSSPTVMSFEIETIQDSGGECTTVQSSVDITVVPGAGSQDFTINCSPATRTITAGGSTSYTLSTTPINGFSSSVAWSGSTSPSGANAPTLSYTNNNQVPSAATAGIVNTTASTTPTTYTITYTATSGALSKQCNVSLIVNPADPIVGVGAAQLAIYETPSVQLQVNGSSSATINVGQSANLTWVTTATNPGTACTASNAWSGSKASDSGTIHSQSTGAIGSVGSYTYSIQCSGGFDGSPVNSTLASVTVNVMNPLPPSFSINCMPPTSTIEPGSSTSYIISISGQNGFNQEVHVEASVDPADGKGVEGPIVGFINNDEIPPADIVSSISTSSTTTENVYTITYTASSSGYTNQTCEVELVVDAIANPETPTNIIASNSGQCGTITIQWRRNIAGADPTGFRVYRRTALVDPWQQLGSDVPYNGEPSSYTFSLVDSSPLSLVGSNYYAVTSFYNSAESAHGLANPYPIVPVACSPNISSSDKDVLSVSGRINRTFTPIVCSGASEIATLPNNALFAPGDIITFQINVCNTGTEALTGVVVTDTYTNLSDLEVLPPKGADCVTNSSVGASSVTIEMEDIAPTNGICSVQLTGIVTSPPNPSAAIYRFQNRGLITANGGISRDVYTPPYLFSVTGGVPNRGETAPQQQ